MNLWTAIVVIVLIGAIANVLRARYSAMNGITEDEYGNQTLNQRSDPAREREVEELRERIAVLERITTDANTPQARETRAISDEIDKLRDI